MTVSGRVRTRAGLCWFGGGWTDAGREGPGSDHRSWLARSVRGHWGPRWLGERGLTSRAMPHIGTLAEFKYCCHVVASLRFALMDVSLLALDFVIRKRACGGMSHMAANVAYRQQVRLPALQAAPPRPSGERVA